MSIESGPAKYIKRCPLIITLALMGTVRYSQPPLPRPPVTTEPKFPICLLAPEVNPTPSPELPDRINPPEEELLRKGDLILPRSTPIPTLTPIPTPEIIFPEEIHLSPWEEKTYQAIEELRLQTGLNTLDLSEPLVELARERSADMASRNYFSHTTPEGLMVFDLLKEKGLYPYGGEILFRTNADGSQIEETIEVTIKKFLKSQSHRQILLRPIYRSVGIGSAVSEDDFRIVTIIFSFPPSTQIYP